MELRSSPRALQMGSKEMSQRESSLQNQASASRTLHKPLKPLTRLKLFMKGEKRIFEHRIHQRRLRAHGGEFDRRVKELRAVHCRTTALHPRRHGVLKLAEVIG